MKELIFNPVYNKLPRGASEEGNKVIYTLNLCHSIPCEKIMFVAIYDDSGKTIKIPMEKIDEDEIYATYQASHIFEKGIYWYHFEIEHNGKCTYVVQSNNLDGVLHNSLTTSFAQIVTKKTYKTTNFKLIYHVFVDRFCKSGEVKVRDCFVQRKDWGGILQKNTKDPVKLNQEVFCGNLQGVIDKLDYLKNLGVDLIYLSPIFSSNSYHKYDTSSYMEVDEMLGGDKVFRKLVEEAKKKKIDILLDGVFNHTGSDSIYFNKNKTFNIVGAYNSQQSKYFDWYHFTEWPTKYDAWWGVPTLPKVNQHSSSYVDFITGQNGVIDKWMNYGIKGFRLDVVDELSNDFLSMISEKIKSFGKDKLIIGEVWEDASIKKAYNVRKKYFIDDQLDSVMNYPLKNGIISYVCTGNEKALVNNIHMLLDHYPKKVLSNLMNIIGTHDSKRIFTCIKEVTDDPLRQSACLKIASMIQYSFPGIPTIFYGDEREVEGGEAPLCRVCFPWERVDTESEKWYKFLGKLRNKSAIRSGEFELLYANSGVIVFSRYDQKEKYIFASNLSQDSFYLAIKHGEELTTNKEFSDEIEVSPNGMAIVRVLGD